MNHFRQMRWNLTLSYTLVTVSAFLLITLILVGLVFSNLFVPRNSLNPEDLIIAWMNGEISSNYPIWSQILSQSPVDRELVDVYLSDSMSIINSQELFRVGAVRFLVSTLASIRVLIFGPDGVLLGTSASWDPALQADFGEPFDPDLVPGLEAPLTAALAGDTEPSHLYTELEPDRRYVMAAPLFRRGGGDPQEVVGAIAVLFDSVPTQADVPAHILSVAGRSLLVFLIGFGLMGALFGAYFAHGLASRFNQIATTTDRWSEGDFSGYIEDDTGDEISELSGRLNAMAGQLQDLLRRRQEMAVSEERNRLARDLHDSAKQQALAASFELGTALTLYDRDPQGAKTHLAQADTLVDAVRRELTDLVEELRPPPPEEEDFAATLQEYALQWSRRSGVELEFRSQGCGELPLEVRETLFRIAQEALANVARHSAAVHARVALDYDPDRIRLTVQDDGRGFDPGAPQAGVGLASMRERAGDSGGSFALESAPGQGTRIEVTLPLEG
jgi:two-component system, NarL family, sensor histidine kinase LiaS